MSHNNGLTSRGICLHRALSPCSALTAGYTKRVMVIYNGVHYDALAISPGPRSVQEEDATEFNPRTKRGKMIIAAAQKLVRWLLFKSTTSKPVEPTSNSQTDS